MTSPLNRHSAIVIRELYSDMTDVELDRLITVIQFQYPNGGYRMMQGYLLRLGHHVEQERVHSAMIRMDPEGILSRWRQTGDESRTFGMEVVR